MKKLLAIVALIAAAPAAAAPANAIAPQAYLEEALTVLETQHINRGKADWDSLKKEARKRARNAATTAETYPAITYVIEALGEKHTELHPAPKPQPPKTNAREEAPRAPFKMPEPSGKLVAGRFGYIGIPSFGAPADHPDADLFTAMSRRLLLNHDRADVCGWIVDVRGNTGGNIWPMLDGLLPLLAPRIGGGPYWSFSIDGKTTPVTMAGGRLVGEGIPERPVFETRMAKKAAAPIAVLIDSETASSAEGVAAVFKGLPNVRHFGETTADYVTVNNPVTLSDGASIQMTVGYSVDRNGRVISGPIEPDEKTTSAAAKDAAIAWLSRQPCTT